MNALKKPHVVDQRARARPKAARPVRTLMPLLRDALDDLVAEAVEAVALPLPVEALLPAGEVLEDAGIEPVRVTPAAAQRVWEAAMAFVRSEPVHDASMQVVVPLTKAWFVHRQVLLVAAQP